ncbi:LD-carboxypeptidase [Roseateles aquatilis]|uniref:LD-carboxypeptidase n=1 Tax=Roseateles aquatilis TaxID=431061 RepID=UPI001303D2DA|nr:LD-carboxypeptidase [Roseateles aquatilis]
MIDVIAPSSPPDDPPATIAAIQAYFARTDLKVRIPKGLIAPTRPLSAANTAERRVAFIEQALHSDAKAIWAILGGGWGSELMPLLRRMRKPARPKPVIGYSDVTALHIFFNHVWGWPTLHGIELGANGDIGNGWNRNPIDETLIVLRGKTPTLTYPLTALNAVATQAEVRDGLRVVGGNSLLLSAMKGSVNFTSDTTHAVLFIESIANGPGEVSRLLDGFLYSPLVRQASAVMFGDFIHVGGRPNPPQEQAQFDFIQRRFAALLEPGGMPVLRAENLFGHGPVNRPLPLNTPARLTLGAAPSLTARSGSE